MEFVDIGYSYLVPLLLLFLLFAKGTEKKYGLALLATANIALIFFFISNCKEYYNLYRMAGIFGMNITFKGLLQLAVTNKLYAAKMVLLAVLPLLFLFKKLSANIFLTMVMLALLWWDVLYALAAHEGFLMPVSQYNLVLFLSLRYLCSLVGMYALLWLLKRLPFQQKK